MPGAANKVGFAERLHSLPRFDAEEELAELIARHGIGLELVQAVIDRKIVPREMACRCWADSLGVAYVDPFASIVTDEAVQLLPLELGRKARALPLYVIEGVLTVAMATPTDTDLIARLSRAIQTPLSAVFALPAEIEDALAVHYSSEMSVRQTGESFGRMLLAAYARAGRDGAVAVEEPEAAAPFLSEVIHFALRERATDIHLEPGQMETAIRFRVDGNLREVGRFSRRLHRALVARLKILCNGNIAEQRFPQDGRFSMPVGSQMMHFRVSTLPAAHGEKAVVRVMASTDRKTSLTLDDMMMSQSILVPFQHTLARPGGITFVTGPTGSGKTTTLYAALQAMNQQGLNISTIEDPIEVQLPGVNQSQTNPHIDLKFSTLLRAILRQDPDVILIGEIRDLETAKIATEAALTGHAVLSSLHTNTAAQAVVRLTEMGVAPHQVAPAISCVLAQRLVARICPGCREAYKPPRKVLLRYFEEDGLDEVPFFRGRGCPACRGTGYKGRIAFHELVLVTEEIRNLIHEQRGVQAITEAAARAGHQSLRFDGLKKVLLGLTTIEEVEQSTPLEWAV